eukprot:CAMPEP_0168613896 /NCGR_PEP_ID=MMETSP0449_2-20121227/3690_1 /TAXON_ID=1082188 /ORGANISM="Strombidium rassoulzadegani, Strain ras09" /LENGTH=54 /DNA_ID=CAMNT_0008654549 /DNA_START=485 /DNA_END=649 /DNA_ORIENTATION=+
MARIQFDRSNEHEEELQELKIKREERKRLKKLKVEKGVSNNYMLNKLKAHSPVL